MFGTGTGARHNKKTNTIIPASILRLLLNLDTLSIAPGCSLVTSMIMVINMAMGIHPKIRVINIPIIDMIL